jgi:hypothetical protein
LKLFSVVVYIVVTIYRVNVRWGEASQLGIRVRVVVVEHCVTK